MGVALDLRLAMLAAFDLVAKLLQARSQLRPVDAGGKLLRLEEATLLERSRLPILPLGHIEDHGMGVELRRGIAVHWPGSVVLEGRGGELARHFRGVHVAAGRSYHEGSGYP